LTDLILKKNQFVDNIYQSKKYEFGIGEKPSQRGRYMVLKLMVRKSTREFLFAEAQEDFIDFVFSFLTLPLGAVVHMLQGISSLKCIDNLYKSMTELYPRRYLISHELKDKLTKPQCAPHFRVRTQLLPTDAASLQAYYCHTYYNSDNDVYCADLTKGKARSKNNTSVPDKFVPFKLKLVGFKSYLSGSFEKLACIVVSSYARGPSTYMVADDLRVTPMSSISTISYLNSSKVPLSDLEEIVIKISDEEVSIFT